MEKVIAIAIPALFIVGIIWLIVASNKRINNVILIIFEFGFDPSITSD